jgi:G3E family GTPase
MTPVPVTVFTGFLGAGKTTIIFELLKQLNDPRIVLLKNEFGDTKVDSQLLSYKTIEIQNGCLCCVLVGRMKNALLELLDLNPSRIIVETSGSAFPAPIAWQIRELSEFSLDSIITVVDCVNFKGYEDTSYTAKMQAQYSDLLVLNKHELVTERELDDVIEAVNELNTDTPRLLWSQDLGLEVFFGLDTKLFLEKQIELDHDHEHHSREVDLITIKSDMEYSQDDVDVLLKKLPKEEVYRVKGLFPQNEGGLILNWAFGRWNWTQSNTVYPLQITVMGVELYLHLKTIQDFFKDATIQYSPRH